MVAAAVAAALPERVGAVILEDPPFHAMGRHIHESLWQAQFLGMREVARRGGSFEAIADGLAEIPLPFPGGVTRRLGEFRDRASLLWSAECISQMDPEVLTPVVEGRWLAGYDELEIARRIRCPVRLLQGDLSAGGALSDREAELFASAVPACRIEKFPGIGHLPHWFAPERVAAIINEFAEPTK
jgi:pimeloyl-ACP methyl ester carboxylesterase